MENKKQERWIVIIAIISFYWVLLGIMEFLELIWKKYYKNY